MTTTACKNRKEVFMALTGERMPKCQVPAHIIIHEGNENGKDIRVIKACGNTFPVKDTLKASGLKWVGGEWNVFLVGDNAISEANAILSKLEAIPQFILPVGA